MTYAVFYYLLLAFGALLTVRHRLDRLGRQLEAVSMSLEAEIASLKGEHGEREVLDDWRASREHEKKASRQFWWFWDVIGAVSATLMALSNR